MIAADIARVCHAANRELQIIQADPTIPISSDWTALDEETKRSAVEGVQGILNGNDARASHEGWTKFKIDNGWSLGPIKDETLKQHPLLIPYDDLPASQQIKDTLFHNIVKALAGT